MAELKTMPTTVSVTAFISAVENETRREDAQTLLKLMKAVTGWKARMWGPTIVGFGSYHYTYATGHAGEMCVIGFSPRKANLVIYFNHDFPEYRSLHATLGKVKPSTGCVYINKLADINLDVLEQMLTKGVAAMKRCWPVTAT